MVFDNFRLIRIVIFIDTVKSFKMAPSFVYALFLLYLTTQWPQTIALTRVDADYDESSCICGLDRTILDKLELIVRASSSSCNINQPNQDQTLNLDPKLSSVLRPLEITENTTIIESSPESSGHQTTPSPQIMTEVGDQHTKEDSKIVETHPNQQVTAGSTVKNEPEASKTVINGDGGSGGSSSKGSSTSVSSIEKLTLEIMKLEKEIHGLQQEASSYDNSPGSGSHKQSPNELEKPVEIQKQNDAPDKVAAPVVNSGFLQGLLIDPANTQDEALMKPNQSSKIEPQDIKSAIQSTVPNVVSNIFSNIQNLTYQTEHGQTEGFGEPTTSSGNSVVKGNTSDEITASGEEIFRVWIEHQIRALHLTASVANQIRKNSMSLFRKIVKQYVESVERVGGSLEDNMRRATQLALTNTQSLIGFLLKYYINFASGLMQIIGEQVSRVGKQLDSTGETIAHVSLNPFDIVSNVMESLPNPSEYSKYFRALGKQLIGQLTGQHDEANPQDGNQHESSTNEPQKSKGLVSKTMGALSKTFGWLG